MSAKVFLVDDDTNLLSALVRQFRKKFDLLTAESGAETLEHSFREDPVAVVVSDMRMPGMDGLELLQNVQKISPETVRIMLTGNADQKTALDAINEGNIFRFYSKPCPPEVLAAGIEEGIAEYNRVIAEKEIFNSTFKGAVKALGGLLSIADPDGVKRSEKIRRWANFLIPRMKIKQSWKLNVAAMLAPLGNISVSREIQAKMHERWELNEAEKEVVNTALESARDLVANIPRLKPVSRIIYQQHKGLNGEGPPYDDEKLGAIPREAKILKILSDLELLTHGPLPTEDAFELLLKHEAEYDADLFTEIRGYLSSGKASKTERAESEKTQAAPFPSPSPKQPATNPEASSSPAEASDPRPNEDIPDIKTRGRSRANGMSVPHPDPQFLPFQAGAAEAPPAKKPDNRIVKYFKESKPAQIVALVSIVILVPAGIYLGSPDRYMGQGDVKKHMELIETKLTGQGLKRGWQLESIKQEQAGRIDIDVQIADPGVVRSIKTMPRIARVSVLKFACPALDPEVQKVLDDGWNIWANLLAGEEKLTGGTCHY